MMMVRPRTCWSVTVMVISVALAGCIDSSTAPASSSPPVQPGGLRVALLQMRGNQLAAAQRDAKLQGFVREAAAAHAQLVVTPSDWLHGNESSFAALKSTARQVGVAVAVAAVDHATGVSTLVLIDSGGTTRATYQKQAEGDGNPIAPTVGDGLASAQLNISGTEVVVGVLLRSDALFPEPARLLMLRQVEIILVAGGEIHGPLRSDALQLTVANRARENAVPVLAATSADDSVASLAEGFGSRMVQKIDQGTEGVALVDIDLVSSAARRAGGTEADNYRRPYDYQPLCFGNGPSTAPDVSLANINESGGAELVVALLQMRTNNTFDASNHSAELEEKAVHFIRQAAQAGADVALMPELWSVGYEAQYPCEHSKLVPARRTVCNRTDALLQWMDLATPVDGSYISRFRRLGAFHCHHPDDRST